MHLCTWVRVRVEEAIQEYLVRVRLGYCLHQMVPVHCHVIQGLQVIQAHPVDVIHHQHSLRGLWRMWAEREREEHGVSGGSSRVGDSGREGLINSYYPPTTQ